MGNTSHAACPGDAGSSDYGYISSRRKLHNTGFTDNKPGSSLEECLEFHSSRMSEEHKPQTNLQHYRFIKVMERLDFEHILTLEEVKSIFIRWSGSVKCPPSRVKYLMFSSEHGIPCYVVVLLDLTSADQRQTTTLFINKTVPQSILLEYLVQHNEEDNQYAHDHKQALSRAIKLNNKKAKSVNSQIAVALNKQLANALHMPGWRQHKHHGFRQLDSEKSNAFDLRLEECAKYEPDMAVLKQELDAKEQRIQKSIARDSKLLKDPRLSKQQRNAFKISVAKSQITLFRIRKDHKSILERRKNYLTRQNKRTIKHELDKMNKGGVGAKVCITSECKVFIELFVGSKLDSLDADERRKVDRISLNHGTTNRGEIEVLCYLYAATCKYLGNEHFNVDPKLALKTLLAHPDEMEQLMHEIVREGIFTMSKSSVSEFAHQGQRQTIQARRCRNRGSMNIAFANKAKVTRSKLHPNHEFGRAQINQRRVSLARLPLHQQKETLSCSQDCGAIRKFGTHEGNDARREKRSLHLKGSLFGLPVSSVYGHPDTFIRPTICVFNEGVYDQQTGRVARVGGFRDQYITISPKTVAYGNCRDMFNQYEYVLMTMFDLILEDGSGFKEGAVETKSHVLSLNQETFTFETYKYQMSFLKFLTRARLLKELL